MTPSDQAWVEQVARPNVVLEEKRGPVAGMMVRSGVRGRAGVGTRTGPTAMSPPASPVVVVVVLVVVLVVRL